MADVLALNEALFVSGLWAPYGTVATAVGREGGARAIAQENWGIDRSRMARADGVTESEDLEKEKVWRDAHPEIVRVHEAFGYVFRRPWPAEWSVTVPELRMLVGEVPSSAGLRLKVNGRYETLLAAADRSSDDEVLWTAVDDIRSLMARL